MRKISALMQNVAIASRKATSMPLVVAYLTLGAMSTWAGPLIIATSVTSQCSGPVLPGYPPTTNTVFVQPDSLTASFYGKDLVYYFTNTSTGQVFPLPGTAANPVAFALPPGNYTLVIKTPPVIGLGQSASGSYNVTVALCKPVGTGPGTPGQFDPVCAQPPSGMNAWWTLDETTAVAHDLTGNLQTNGVRFGPSNVAGMVGKAAHFNGINDYIEVPSQSALDIAAADVYGSGDLSMDAWVKVDPTDSTSGVRVIVEKRAFTPPSHYKGFSFYLYNGYLGLQVADDVNSPGYANYGAPSLVVQRDGAWHFVAVSVKRRPPVMLGYPSTVTVQFTLDNISSIVSSPALVGSLVNSSPLRIGMRTIDNGGAFNGTIDEVEFFHRFVPAEEWQPIVNAGSAGKCRPAPRP